MLPAIVAKGCDELWLNPGADAPEVVEAAEKLGHGDIHFGVAVIHCGIEDYRVRVLVVTGIAGPEVTVHE